MANEAKVVQYRLEAVKRMSKTDRWLFGTSLSEGRHSVVLGFGTTQLSQTLQAPF